MVVGSHIKFKLTIAGWYGVARRIRIKIFFYIAKNIIRIAIKPGMFDTDNSIRIDQGCIIWCRTKMVPPFITWTINKAISSSGLSILIIDLH